MTSDSHALTVLPDQWPGGNSKMPLTQQRLILRSKIRAQREVLSYQLGPAPEAKSDYPRSMIMRFLTQHPALATGLFGKLATLVLGTRFLKSTGAAMVVARVAQSMLSKQR
ncbi:MAG: hypothetical protein ACREPB_03640 [Arenimonas sp.]